MKKIFVLKQSFVLSAVLLVCTHYTQAQTNIFPSTGSAGIGTTTPNASSILDMVSTKKGMLVPRMTKNQRDSIKSPATGLLIYETNGIGFYYYTGTVWQAITPKAGWLLTGNAGTNPAANFIGTVDARPLVFKVNSEKAGYLGTPSTANTAFGYQTLNANTSGTYNTASGFQALYSNTTGHDNTANGFWSLPKNTIGYYNTATGGYSLQVNSDGISNTANGISALRFNTHGSDNTAVGANALFNNTTGYSNVAIGSNALFNNTIATNCVAIGDSALYQQTGTIVSFITDGGNTAVGSKALYSSIIGLYNTALGAHALYFNTSADNTASGFSALYQNRDGGANTATGYNALASNIHGNNNSAIGYEADANNDSYNNGTALGAHSVITASNQVRIGDGNITSIGGYAGWTTLPSDKRVKKNIKENVPGLAFINKLKPVTYNLDLNAIDNIVQHPAVKDKDEKAVQPSQQELDSRKAKEQIVFTGFVAQDVVAAASSIHYDFSGVDVPKNDKDIYGLRYSDFVVPLVKAVQELSKMNDSKDAKINDLETRLAKLEAMMNVYQSATNLSLASLTQNVPNPFSNTTTISYNLPQHFTSAQIIITDNAGKALKQVDVSGSGKGFLQLNASVFSSSSYQYSLLVDGKLIDTKQMVLAK